MDLDGFKRVNATFGHEMEDGLLALVAARFKVTARETPWRADCREEYSRRSSG